MTQESIVTAKGITKSYSQGDGASFNAVDDVTLDFSQGEVTAILGPNGAGKTTFLDIVLGLNTPDNGEITVKGHSPAKAVHAGHVGALLQTGGLLPDLKVKETVQIIASLHRSHIGVDNALELAGLTSIASRPVGKCSGGQQQRVKFALALLPEPDLLILDEPTAGMDPMARHEFWERMKAQAESGTTVLFATHYLEEAEQFARRIVMMDKGKVIADGPTDQVRQHAGAAHVIVNWSPSPEELAALPEIDSYKTNGLQFSARTNDADTLARYLLTCTDAHGLTIRPASLEEAFMDLTGNASSSQAFSHSTEESA